MAARPIRCNPPGAIAASTSDTAVAPPNQRSVQVEREAQAWPVPCHVLGTAVDGDVVTGPALVDGADTSIWIPRGGRASFDASGGIMIEVSA